MPVVDVDAVTALIQRVSAEIVMPRFRTLGEADIQRKPTAGHADDIVTIVDREAEEALTSGLRDLLPSASVIGEEAAHRHPALLDLVRQDSPTWIVDPLDGTSNFASGVDGFGVMVCLAIGGRARLAWVYLPARAESFVAEEGAGAFLNGTRLRVPSTAAPASPRAALFVRYMPDDLRADVQTRLRGRITAVDHGGAAAIEYTSIARGHNDLALYYRLLPWDHGAPALILTEAGGVVCHADGAAYTIRSTSQLTFVARNRDVAEVVRAWLAHVPED